MEIKQNTLYLTTQGSYVSRDHLNLRVEVDHELKLSVPIHHLESICVFGQAVISPHAAELCWEHGVSVNYFSENGYFIGRWEGVASTSVLLRRAQYRAADDSGRCASIARQCVAGKLQNSRQSLLRSARETDSPEEAGRLQAAVSEISRLLRLLERCLSNGDDEVAGEDARDWTPASALDRIRGYEGHGASLYFDVFTLHLRQQREDFTFTTRVRRPARDRINCLLSFLYALLRHDCIAALTATGLDPFVGYLHTERPNRPALALDMMEEFRPMIADRLAITLVNRKQVGPRDFVVREGGAVECTKEGRKAVIAAYQTRKQETVTHPILGQEFRIGHLMLAQARILARHLRGDLQEYLPCVLR
ncbi:MAG TPA: type I-C CRISPR-associated endonuclease Cas1c [Blastocatellia bacterium]|nr:type I-C CRISPR-associated endonuclease Cas1c [Blastocatellia bacterium]